MVLSSCFRLCAELSVSEELEMMLLVWFAGEVVLVVVVVVGDAASPFRAMNATCGAKSTRKVVMGFERAVLGHL